MQQLFSQLRKDWMILLFIGTVIMSWTMFSARLSQAEEKISGLEKVIDSINQINVDVAVIKNQIVTINDKLE